MQNNKVYFLCLSLRASKASVAIQKVKITLNLWIATPFLRKWLSMTSAKLAQDIENAIRFIKPCSKCGALSENELCEICADDERDRDLLCLVEDAKDILILEESGSFNGLYFVLDELSDNKIAKLRAMIAEFSVKELVFALTHSVNAEAMSFFVEDKLADLNLSMSKIAQGVPSGVHLENVDFISLHKAMVFRTKLK